MLNVLQICAIFASVWAVHSARILVVFHMPSYSHFQIANCICSELAARGHEVTAVVPYELKSRYGNLKEIFLRGFAEEAEAVPPQLYGESDLSIPARIMKLDKMGYNFTEETLSHPNVQKLLKSNEKFDLVIHDLFHSEAFVGFAHHYNAPSIAVSGPGLTQWASSKMANPHNPAHISDFYLGYPKHMNLLQRVLNTLLYLATELYYNFYSLPNQNKLLQKYFPGSPNLFDLHHNASLMLINSHLSMQNPVPLVPNMIEIGGVHIKPPKALPKDLKDFLDNAKNGAILFSLGSVLKSKDMPVQKRVEILRALGKLKERVLWKWEDDQQFELPPNIRLVKWLPQQAVLAHPNIKLFISHGGLMSTTEAIHYGIPVLGLPAFGDQEFNIVNAEKSGFAIGLPFKKVNENSLSVALHEILNNPRYAENAKRRARILQDQPQKPLDTAVYWIEYVLRHQGAPHLKTAALNLHWYQYLLLDVVAVVILSLVALLYIFCKIVEAICGGMKKKLGVKQKQN